MAIKSESEKASAVIKFRIKGKEKAALQAEAKEKGIGLTELLKARLYGRPTRDKVYDKSNFESIDRLTREMNSIGNNINQSTITIHQIKNSQKWRQGSPAPITIKNTCVGLVFKMFTPSASFHGVDYNEKKQRQGSAELVYFENFGHFQNGRTEISKGEFVHYFGRWSARNSRVANPQFHAILSCKQKEYSRERLKEVALEIMGKMGYEGIPTLIYAHKDTDNNHVHIVTSRVGVDGKKINHDFERQRSHEILNQILEIEPAEVYKKELEEVMSYKYSPVALMALLMERKGCNVVDKEATLCFYKHGRKQGFVSKEEIKNKISNEKSVKDINQIRAWLYKYAAKYDSRVGAELSAIYTSKPKEFTSRLTEQLRKKFGAGVCIL